MLSWPRGGSLRRRPRPIIAPLHTRAWYQRINFDCALGWWVGGCRNSSSGNPPLLLPRLVAADSIFRLIISISSLIISMSSLKISISSLKISISGLKILISGLKISISGLKILIPSLKISISGLKISISSLKISVSSLKISISRLKISSRKAAYRTAIVVIIIEIHSSD